MGKRWFLWRFILRKLAQKQGLIDPVRVLSQLQRFAQPSEVAVPREILRLGAILYARGMINAQAIQHNLDWVWPYWVVRQFDPRDRAFVPRAFSMTHINLTHRNWTAVGLPDSEALPIVDPCGLVTPLYDGWSLDAWIINADGKNLLPSRMPEVEQKLILKGNLAVLTRAEEDQKVLVSRVEVVLDQEGQPVCRLSISGYAPRAAWIAVSVRPYNPEGISFVDHIALLEGGYGWKVNKKNKIYFEDRPERVSFSNYHEGDVYGKLPQGDRVSSVSCRVGMATAAALYALEPQTEREISLCVPLEEKTRAHRAQAPWVDVLTPLERWQSALEGSCKLQIPDARFQLLYEAAIRAMILHSPSVVYPGPFTYKHFWFRDAVFILHAMISCGLVERVEKILDSFPARQMPTGYFKSQEGEWDSNGQVLWILQQFCQMTDRRPKANWKSAILKGAKWIIRKRLPEDLEEPHAGLFPAGFSAEHLGSSDFYFWDNFWGIQGLRSASWLLEEYEKSSKTAETFKKEAMAFLDCTENSLRIVAKRQGHLAMPASPYRRMDTGAIGSLVVDYPLRIWQAGDRRVMATVDFLLKECFVAGGFFHDMSHSGINPYLTLHIAQVLLRGGDVRYFEIMRNLAELASRTGQWPEAVHPQTGGGCMGDGQHIWAAAEWFLMIRNCFVREEEDRLLLCSGIPSTWLKEEQELSFGPVLTNFGRLHLTIRPAPGKVKIEWQAEWYKGVPPIEIRFPGQPVIEPLPQETSAVLTYTRRER